MHRRWRERRLAMCSARWLDWSALQRLFEPLRVGFGLNMLRSSALASFNRGVRETGTDPPSWTWSPDQRVPLRELDKGDQSDPDTSQLRALIRLVNPNCVDHGLAPFDEGNSTGRNKTCT